jgi:hypothetical protein
MVVVRATWFFAGCGLAGCNSGEKSRRAFMKFQKKQESRRISGRSDVSGAEAPVRGGKGWFAVLAWAAVSVLVFIILFRLGLRAAQARRVTWLVAVAGALYAAFQALLAEVHRPAPFSPTVLTCLGALGGVVVAFLLWAANAADLAPPNFLAGALIGGVLANLSRRWG